MTKPHTTLSEAVRALEFKTPRAFNEAQQQVYREGIQNALAAAAALVEQHEAQEPVPEGWQVTHMPPWGAMTDAAQAAQRISVQRLVAPFCDKAGLRVWCGPTLEAAMQTAHAALKLPYKPAATAPVSQPTLAATLSMDVLREQYWDFKEDRDYGTDDPFTMMLCDKAAWEAWKGHAALAATQAGDADSPVTEKADALSPDVMREQAATMLIQRKKIQVLEKALRALVDDKDVIEVITRSQEAQARSAIAGASPAAEKAESLSPKPIAYAVYSCAGVHKVHSVKLIADAPDGEWRSDSDNLGEYWGGNEPLHLPRPTASGER